MPGEAPSLRPAPRPRRPGRGAQAPDPLRPGDPLLLLRGGVPPPAARRRADRRHRPGKPRGRADAAGSLLTTARDYGRFLSAVLSGSGLTPSLREEMLRPQASIASDRLFGSPAVTGPATGREPTPFWALGWGGFEDSSGTARFHVGYDSPEYESYAVLYPARNLGVVVLTAGGSGPGSSSPGLVRALLGHTRTPFAWMGY
ncbi:MAG: serine hydrolase [Thermoanaerobaculia bacterium]